MFSYKFGRGSVFGQRACIAARKIVSSHTLANVTRHIADNCSVKRFIEVRISGMFISPVSLGGRPWEPHSKHLMNRTQCFRMIDRRSNVNVDKFSMPVNGTGRTKANFVDAALRKRIYFDNFTRLRSDITLVCSNAETSSWDRQRYIERHLWMNRGNLIFILSGSPTLDSKIFTPLIVESKIICK